MPKKEPKDVVLAAFHYLANILPPTQKISEVRIEEVKNIENEGANTWSVILSYDNTGEFPFDRTREFKKFTVADDDARVLSMERIDK